VQVHTALQASGSSHPGLVREGNEDRFHVDPARGIFAVIDGVGGQAAGETAAETALGIIRTQLENGHGTPELRIRHAILSANNEIFDLAARRPEWKGMACVLTLVIVDGADAVVGHVGDTRLYKLRGGRIEKLTRDHSPVGEREDAGELSEDDAMRHPRRNEVYRDVGSERRAGDTSFIDTFRVPFENDAALLLCSDGLSDLVPSATIRETVEQLAGHPYEVARTLVEAANDAGGKDNVTVVYVEGSRFAEGEDTGAISRRPRPAPVAALRSIAAREEAAPKRSLWRTASIAVLLIAVVGWSVYQQGDFRWSSPTLASPAPQDVTIVVRSGESISAAIQRAAAGASILVEPGEYREQLVLKPGVLVRGRVPRSVSLRLPGTSAEFDAAVIADGVAGAELRGFKIVGDAATPLGTGVLVRQSDLTLTDVEISGARTAAVVFASGSGALIGSDVHDNPGLAVKVQNGAEPRIAHNTFARNATSERSAGTVLVEAGARPSIANNVFIGVGRETLLAPPGTTAAIGDNWFIAPTPSPNRRGRTATPRGRQ
jgi:serine/threonine protein phosphatase PrpC